MAHEISEESGRAEIAYAGETPWHGLGTRVEGLQTSAAMLAAAGLEWMVGKRPLLVDLGNSNTQQIDSHEAIYRQDTGRVLGIATTRYAPIQNAQAADIVDALVAEGGAHVEVAGALGHGGRCWMLARIPQEFEVTRGDAVKTYFLLAWGHDGLHGIAGKLTPVRVVCNNTLAAAGLGKTKWSRSADVYLRHSKNAASVRIDEARRALGLVRRQVDETAEAYRALAARRITDGAAAEYFATVFPAPEAPAPPVPDEHGRALARWTARQAELARLYAEGPGADRALGTAWGAYNAVAAWIDHSYPVLKSGEVSPSRRESVAFGFYAGARDRALQLALA